MKPPMNTEQPSRNQTKVLRVLRAFAVKVQPRIHREAAKISRRKILSCQERILGLVIQMDTDVARIHLCESVFIRGFPRRYELLASN